MRVPVLRFGRNRAGFQKRAKTRWVTLHPRPWRLFELGFLGASEQIVEPLMWGNFLRQHQLDLFADRQLHPDPSGKPHHLIDGLDRFDHLADLSHRRGQRHAAAERQAKASVAR